MLDPADDPFIAGVRWAAGEAFSRLFGDVLGPLLLDELGGLEVYGNGAWSPYTA